MRIMQLNQEQNYKNNNNTMQSMIYLEWLLIVQFSWVWIVRWTNGMSGFFVRIKPREKRECKQLEAGLN